MLARPRSPHRMNQKRIIDLLCGRTVQDKRGLPQQRYLKNGSAEELEARRALVRYLRKSRPIDLGIRWVIADLVDPDCIEIDRQIRIEHRRKGKPSKSALAEKKIAEFVWSQVQAGIKAESAIKSAKEKFGLGRSRIFKIWSQEGLGVACEADGIRLHDAPKRHDLANNKQRFCANRHPRTFIYRDECQSTVVCA
jgi:hypothetical protein